MRRASHLRRLLAGNPRRSVVFLALLFALGATAVAIAKPGGAVLGDNPSTPATGNSPFNGLAQVGPVAKNGFPAWYKDRNGTRLEPCLDSANPLCIMGALPQADQPLTPDDVSGNFPDEFFYQAAGAGIDNVGAADARGRAGKASLDAAIEGAFLNGLAAPNEQMVFARLRLKVTSGLTPGADYLFVHPYGQRTIQVDANQDNLFVTEDIGATVGAFSDALKGRVAPFLKWDPNVDPQAPAGYAGDPNVDHAVTGGVNDYFAIIGPGVGANKLADGTQDCPDPVLAKANNAPGGAISGTGPNRSIGQADCIYQNLFSLMGKMAENAGVDVKGATFSRDATGNTAVDVHAESDANQSIVVRPTNSRTIASRLFSPTKLTEDQGGQYYAHVTMDSTKGFPSGAENQVEVINGTDGSPQDAKTVTPIDEIVNATATWDNTLDADGHGSLTVAAQSSDRFGGDNVTLSLDDPSGGQPIALANGQATVTTLPTPPHTVTITSSKGGTLTIPVHADVSKPATPAPLAAVVRGSVKAVPTGASVKLFGTGSTGPIASYAWNGPFAIAADGTVDTATPNDANGGAVSGSADTDTATLTAPSAAGQYGYQLEVTGDDGNTATATTVLTVTDGGVAVPGAGDPLTPGKIRYTGSQGRMVVDGTATVRISNKILIWFASHVPADPASTKPDATAIVDPVDGSWVFDTGRGGMPTPPNADCVSYISIYGNTAVVGDNTTLAPADEWNCLPIDGRQLAAPLPAAGPPPGGPVAAAAAAAPRAIAGAVPLAGAAAPKVAAAKVAAPATVTAAALATTGVPVNVTVPAGATLLRLRVLTTANKALATTFKKVKGGKKVKVTIRSAKAARKLRGAKRFVVEVRAGTAKNRLGKATRTVIRIRR